MKMADVCDDDGVSGESLRKKGAERLLSFFYFYPNFYVVFDSSLSSVLKLAQWLLYIKDR
jgi:hypothetical protein